MRNRKSMLHSNGPPAAITAVVRCSPYCIPLLLLLSLPTPESESPGIHRFWYVGSHTTIPGPLSLLPGGRPPFELPSGTVRLLADPNWNSGAWDLRIFDDDTNTPNFEYNINGSWMDDRATWAAFNLPVGVAVTMHEHSVGRSVAADVAGCGKVVDLVGTGQTEGVNLEQMGFDDTMTAWFWRYVDLDVGAIELYEHPNYGGTRTIIFLSDWEPGSLHNISGWFMNDKTSSAKWGTLDDRVTCMLWADIESGSSKLLAGYNKTREFPNFEWNNMDDKISSFKWNGLVPRKEIIKPFQIPLNLNMSDSRTFTASTKYFNDTDLEQEFEVKLERTDAETLTVTTTDSHRVGFAVTVTYSVEAGVEGVAKASSSLSMTLSYDYTRTESTEKSTTRTNTLAFTKTFKASPRKTTVGSLIIRVGTVPRTEFETTARRWYDIKVAGSEMDPDYRGLYVREEVVKGYLEGGLRAEVEIHDYYQE